MLRLDAERDPDRAASPRITLGRSAHPQPAFFSSRQATQSLTMLRS
jgi:hypothetical protein